MSVTAKQMRVQVGATIHEVRSAMGWSQRELGRRAGLSQSEISKIERCVVDQLTFDVAGRLMDSLGIRAMLDLRAPFIADRRRQRDGGHARCLAYVARRLERLGWSVLTEVEIVSGTARGWIDVLAYRAADRTLLVIEVKTEIEDLGQVQRQLGWYAREAWRAARGAGWRPAVATAVLLVLASARNHERIAANASLLGRDFTMSSSALDGHVAGTSSALLVRGQRALAMIDPLDRSRKWLLRSPIERRPAGPRYADYADFARRIGQRR